VLWLIQPFAKILHVGGKLCQLIIRLILSEVVREVVFVRLIQYETDLVFMTLALEEKVC